MAFPHIDITFGKKVYSPAILIPNNMPKVLDLFPELQSIPDIPVDNNMIIIFIDHINLPLIDRYFITARELLNSEHSKLFRYIFNEFMKGSHTSSTIANSLGMDSRVTLRYLNKGNLIALFYEYSDKRISSREFFEELKKEKL